MSAFPHEFWCSKKQKIMRQAQDFRRAIGPEQPALRKIFSREARGLADR